MHTLGEGLQGKAPKCIQGIFSINQLHYWAALLQESLRKPAQNHVVAALMEGLGDAPLLQGTSTNMQLSRFEHTSTIDCQLPCDITPPSMAIRTADAGGKHILVVVSCLRLPLGLDS
jgi:hypothetical protein